MAAYLLRNWQLGVVGFLTISGVLTSGADRTLAQITPDGTLGAEGSVVTPGVDVGVKQQTGLMVGQHEV